VDGEVGPALEETIAGVLEDGLVTVSGELFGSPAPGFIDRLTELLCDVKTVEQVEGGGQQIRGLRNHFFGERVRLQAVNFTSGQFVFEILYRAAQIVEIFTRNNL
jgi:hypothetical protein